MKKILLISVCSSLFLLPNASVADDLDEKINQLKKMDEAANAARSEKGLDQEAAELLASTGACWLQRGTFRSCYDLTYAGCRRAAQSSGSIISSWIPGGRC